MSSQPDAQPDSFSAPPNPAEVKVSVNQSTAQTSTASEPRPEAAKTEQSGKSGWQRFWQSQRENVQILAIALVLAVVIRLFVAEPRYIPSDSMEPTLQIGDRLVVEKISYRLHPPQLGDIVVFAPPRQFEAQFGFLPDKAFIKRVIGTAGDRVRVQKGIVYLNQTPLQEPYIAEPPAYQMTEVEVPSGQVFVMGDNRNNSNDSHVWGFLPEENIIGRAVFRFFPFDRIGQIKAPKI
jgi:signal peptidase I